MEREYTDEELMEFLEQHQVDGLISEEVVAEFIFDTKFPADKFEFAKKSLMKSQKIWARFDELTTHLKIMWEEIDALQKNIKAMGKNPNVSLKKVLLKKEQLKEIENNWQKVKANRDAVEKLLNGIRK